MHKDCPSCGQPTEIEVGFYYGTGYVSYGLSVAFSVATFVAWKVLIGMTFSINDDRILYWMGTNILLLIIMQPILMRLSRTLWLSWFVSYQNNWKDNPIEKPERVVACPFFTFHFYLFTFIFSLKSSPNKKGRLFRNGLSQKCL